MNIDFNLLFRKDGRLSSHFKKALSDEQKQWLKETYQTDREDEALYLLYHNKSKPKCLVCGSKVSFTTFQAGYLTFCSNECSRKFQSDFDLSPLNKKDLLLDIEPKLTLTKDKILKPNGQIEEKFCKQYFLSVNYPNDFNYAVTKAKELNITSLTEFWYFILNSYKQRPVCARCGGRVTFSNFTEGYRIYCCSDCANKSTVDKVTETQMRLYGVKRYTQTQESKDRYVQMALKKYGVTNYCLTEEYKEFWHEKGKQKAINRALKYNMELISEYNGFWCKAGEGYMKEYLYRCKQCGHKFKAPVWFDENICPVCNPKVIKISSLHQQILDYIKSVYSGDIIIDDRKLIKPYEIDIYLPDLNLAFEVNGIYYHSLGVKPLNYHKLKSDMCAEKGITLIHLWEHQWYFKQDIIKSMILNKLKLINNKIYARNCSVSDVSYQKSSVFLKNNHIQTLRNSAIRLGLYHKDELVSLLTARVYSEQNYIEIDRFASKLYTNVIGAFSKLLKHLMTSYPNLDIKTYGARDWNNISDNFIYSKLGFDLESVTEPTVWYIDMSNGQALSWKRFMPTTIGSKSKEDYYCIADSGNFRFVYKHKG